MNRRKFVNALSLTPIGFVFIKSTALFSARPHFSASEQKLLQLAQFQLLDRSAPGKLTATMLQNSVFSPKKIIGHSTPEKLEFININNKKVSIIKKNQLVSIRIDLV